MAAAMMAVWMLSPAAALIVSYRTQSLVTFAFAAVAGISIRWVLDLCVRSSAVRDSRSAVSVLATLPVHYQVARHEANEYVDALSAQNASNLVILSAQPKSPETPPLGTLKAFMNPLRTSLIIVNEPPDSKNQLQQFFVYHEIAHVSEKGVVRSVSMHLPWLRFGFMYLPCVLLVEGTVPKLLVVIAAALHACVEVFELGHEIAADMFAVTHIYRAKGVGVLPLLRVLERHFARNAADPRDGNNDRAREFYWRGRTLRTVREALEAGKDSFLRRGPADGDFIAGMAGFAGFVARATVLVCVAVWPRPFSIGWLGAAFVAGALVAISAGRMVTIDEALQRQLDSTLSRFT